jgi:hypothetical protein
MTPMKASAFSRVRLKPPRTRPSESHSLGRGTAAVRRTLTSHSIRQMKNRSRNDFCSRLSKKIAGA